MTLEIKLSRGLAAIIDDADLPLVSGYTWYSRVPCGGIYTAYAIATLYKPKRQVSMHRLIMGATSGSVVDHIDGNGLNNTRANLRVCAQNQNCRNRRVNRDSLLGFKGVRLLGKSFQARIRADGKMHHLGCYPTAQEAAAVYDAAALSLHGEFARLNSKMVALP